MPHVCCDEDVDDEPKGSPVLPLDAVLTRLGDLKFGLWPLAAQARHEARWNVARRPNVPEVLLWQIDRVIGECADLQADVYQVVQCDEDDGDEGDRDDADRAEHIKTAGASAVAEIAP